ncbi:MAG: single-stranded DNA-binding protein [Armatimonadota bacterium]|jgi:single stranded DNA-binding protein
MINSVVLVGNLGRDPELTYTQSGMAICKFPLGVNRPPRRGADQGQSGERAAPVDTSENCPQCEGGTLQIREGRRGKFLGCTNYPNCTYSRDYDGNDSGGTAGSTGGAPREETDWLDIVCFGRTAENSGQYLSKGARVGIEGRVQTSTWQRDDGSKGYRVEINAYRVHFLESRQEREAREGSQSGGYQQQRPPQGPPQQQQGPPQQEQRPAPQEQGGPDIDWTMDEEEDPFGDQ